MHTSNGIFTYSGIPVFVIYLKIYSGSDNTTAFPLYHKCCGSNQRAGGGRQE
jgi:hypothetical protein